MKRRMLLKEDAQTWVITDTSTTRIPVRTSAVINLDEAIQAVYRKYGTDLQAFFRDAFKEAARQGERRTNTEVHPQ